MEHPRARPDEEEEEGCLADVHDFLTWITLPRASARRAPATRSDPQKRICRMDRRRKAPFASVELREVPLAIEALQYVQPWMLRRWGSGRRLPRAKRLRAFIAQSNWRRDAYFTWQRTGIHQYQRWIETPSPWPLRTL